MESKISELRGEEKKKSSDTGQVKIAEVIYGSRALVECMEEVLKFYGGK